MSHRIVVAEDDSLIARLIVYKLEREGYEVHLAQDGGEALDTIRSVRPDAVILDVMMPVMDGFEVLKHLRDDGALSSTPVMMLTARGQEQDVVKGFNLGCDDYLVKPFRPAELIARVQKVLKGAGRNGD